MLASCTSERESNPPRSASQRLLVSRAAERAALEVELPVRPGTRVYIDADGFEGMDGAYAVGAVRDQLLRRGARLAMDRRSADVIVALTTGALSIDKSETTFGIPAFNIPVPLAGDFEFPGLSLLDEKERRGIAKVVATAIGAEDGAFIASTGPRLGYSHQTDVVAFLFLAWSQDDLIPPDQREGRLQRLVPPVPWADYLP